MSRRKMIGAHAPRPAAQKYDRWKKKREVEAAYEKWSKKPGNSHLAFHPATYSGVRIT